VNLNQCHVRLSEALRSDHSPHPLYYPDVFHLLALFHSYSLRISFLYYVGGFTLEAFTNGFLEQHVAH